MHTQFANHVTSSAFTLTMNRTAIIETIEMYVWEDENIKHGWCPWQVGHSITHKSTIAYMLRRGLIRNISQDPRDRDDYCLTRPGILTAQLLIEAGFGEQEMMDAIRRMARPACTVNDAIWTEEFIRERWGQDYSGTTNMGNTLAQS